MMGNAGQQDMQATRQNATCWSPPKTRMRPQAIRVKLGTTHQQLLTHQACEPTMTSSCCVRHVDVTRLPPEAHVMAATPVWPSPTVGASKSPISRASPHDDFLGDHHEDRRREPGHLATHRHRRAYPLIVMLTLMHHMHSTTGVSADAHVHHESCTSAG
ncbi:hypothetical protein FDECE_12213 [Fusarium decemcellulare]|nr:hypothetical protein FDECE_12213 [Fusarium decemcellulare]